MSNVYSSSILLLRIMLVILGGIRLVSSIIQHPDNVTAFINDTIHFRCKFEIAVYCSWLRCGKPFEIGKRITYMYQDGRSTTNCTIKVRNINQADINCGWICENKTTRNISGTKSVEAWIILKKGIINETIFDTEVKKFASSSTTTLIMTTKQSQEKLNDGTSDWEKDLPVGVILSAAVSGGFVTLTFIVVIIGFSCYRCSKSKQKQVIQGAPVIHSVSIPPEMQYVNSMCRHSMMTPSTSSQQRDSQGYMIPIHCMNTAVGQRPDYTKYKTSPWSETQHHFYEQIHDAIA